MKIVKTENGWYAIGRLFSLRIELDCGIPTKLHRYGTYFILTKRPF